MRNSLIQAYLPLVIWVRLRAWAGPIFAGGVTAIAETRVVLDWHSLEIFALARQTQFAKATGLALLYTVGSLGLRLDMPIAFAG